MLIVVGRFEPQLCKSLDFKLLV